MTSSSPDRDDSDSLSEPVVKNRDMATARSGCGGRGQTYGKARKSRATRRGPGRHLLTPILTVSARIPTRVPLPEAKGQRSTYQVTAGITLPSRNSGNSARRRRDFCVTSGRITPLSRSSGNAARRRRDLCVTSGRR